MTSPPHRAGKNSARRLDPPPPPPAAINCPRCDSQNTKFCYYNNYSLTQPRYFCKTCRRYWTKGGALRSVPVGGGCRKTKKPTVRSSSSSGSSSSNHCEHGGLKLFQGFSPALDYQHNYGHPNTALSFGDFSANPSNPNSRIPSPLLGFNYCNPSLGFQEVGPTFVNQDPHQQRLALLFAGDNNNNNNISNINQTQVVNRNIPLSIDQPLVRNSGTAADGDLSTEWFFDDHYATRENANPTPASSGIRAWTGFTRY